MAKAIRVIFVLALASAYCVVCWLSFQPELLMITLLIFGLIAIIIAVSPIQIEMQKRREPVAMPLMLLLLSALLFYLGHLSLDLLNFAFWQFWAMSLYLVNVSGFLLGMALSPLMAKRRGKIDSRVDEEAISGITKIKQSGLLPFMIFLLLGVLATLYFAGSLVYQQISSFGEWQQWLAYLSLLALAYLVIRLTFRSSIWGDPQVYGFYNDKIMKDYQNIARDPDDQL
jgi:hypothetical protein